MDSMKESYLKSLNPSVAVKLTQLSDTKTLKDVTKNIFNILSYKYKTFYDEKEGVIYIGTKV